MDKDQALVTMNVPDYHDGLREKPVNVESEKDSSVQSEKRVFQVHCYHVPPNIITLIFSSALYQPTCH